MLTTALGTAAAATVGDPADAASMDADAAFALIMLAKSPVGGGAKTRLAAQISMDASDSDGSTASTLSAGSAAADAAQWAAAFVSASVSDLAVRLQRAAGSRCVLFYAPPTAATRAWFESLLENAGVAAAWRLEPALACENLGDVMADAIGRARTTCGVQRVAICGCDCPELPLRSLVEATQATTAPGVAAICPARDGGFTLLALPAGCDAAAAFAGVRWSAADTCATQVDALERCGLSCVVGETHADIDDLDDLRALDARLRGGTEPPDDLPGRDLGVAGARGGGGGGSEAGLGGVGAAAAAADADADRDDGQWPQRTVALLGKLRAEGVL